MDDNIRVLLTDKHKEKLRNTIQSIADEVLYASENKAEANANLYAIRDFCESFEVVNDINVKFPDRK